jgi:integrase
LKLDAIKRMKATIYEARHGSKTDPLIREAMAVKAGLEAARQEPVRYDPDGYAQHRKADTLELVTLSMADEIRAREGDSRADTFGGIAFGVQHPLSLYVDDWIAAAEYAPRTEASMRQAVSKLETWCQAKGDIPATIETVTPKIAARYVEEVFEKPRVASQTANKLISGLSSYWKWLRKTHRLDPDQFRNPWLDTRVAREKKHRQEMETDKRPFTDKEVATLLNGIRVQPVADMMRISFACGMRLTEIASLRVERVANDKVQVRIGKSAAGQREFPMPTAIKAIIARRIEGKGASDYLFDDLPGQESGKRGRGAPASQSFTRERRRLGVDDTPQGAVQSRVDFHSCRRWFIRKAVEALEGGAKGFTGWTIADIVGHDTKTDGPLPLTMGLYPGRADLKAMRACLNSVNLP